MEGGAGHRRGHTPAASEKAKGKQVLSLLASPLFELAPLSLLDSSFVSFPRRIPRTPSKLPTFPAFLLLLLPLLLLHLMGANNPLPPQQRRLRKKSVASPLSPLHVFF